MSNTRVSSNSATPCHQHMSVFQHPIQFYRNKRWTVEVWNWQKCFALNTCLVLDSGYKLQLPLGQISVWRSKSGGDNRPMRVHFKPISSMKFSKIFSTKYMFGPGYKLQLRSAPDLSMTQKRYRRGLPICVWLIAPVFLSRQDSCWCWNLTTSESVDHKQDFRGVAQIW